MIVYNNGRIKPKDVQFINLVIKSLENCEKIPYGIVVNQTQKRYRCKKWQNKSSRKNPHFFLATMTFFEV